MRMPTLLPFGESRASGGSNRHTHPLDPPGSWARPVGRVMRVIGGRPVLREGSGLNGVVRRRPGRSRTGSYER